ncbi:MAG: hypothetical protein KKE96_06745 [Candidatus Altiarchaeota archaeon]|nr:hypothetical protein [Candidatus Altiarchaeota archaeon]MBU4341211.1 hypothetical protein [Candidatus Altiarchaeota archaeon]MBU4437092.1 hypothetical protein [Candidatus Altiarchaeota archaeon]
MEVVVTGVDEDVLNALKHVREWKSITAIAEMLGVGPNKAEGICWKLAGKGLLLWIPGAGRRQLFRYALETKRRESDVLAGVDLALGRGYYVTGHTGLFLHGIEDHGMFQRRIDIALPRNRYRELVEKLVQEMARYAIILPQNLPEHCNKEAIFADALKGGNLVVVRKAGSAVRRMKFHGDANLPGMDVILEELDSDDEELLKYAFRALDHGLSQEKLGKMGRKRRILAFLKDYLQGNNVPEKVLKSIKKAENARGH